MRFAHPSNAILGMTELVLDSPLTPVQRHYLKLVYESGESLLTVVDDILKLSKIEAGKLTLEQVSFDLREFLGDVLKSLGLRTTQGTGTAGGCRSGGTGCRQLRPASLTTGAGQPDRQCHQVYRAG